MVTNKTRQIFRPPRIRVWKRFLLIRFVSVVRRWETRPLQERKVVFTVFCAVSVSLLTLNLYLRMEAAFQSSPPPSVQLKSNPVGLPRLSSPPLNQDSLFQQSYLLEKEKFTKRLTY